MPWEDSESAPQTLGLRPMTGVDFIAELAQRLSRGGAPAVIGLDPRLDALPKALLPDAKAPERIVGFYREVLPALAEAGVVCVKPNIAFFECFGADGFRAYETTCALARNHDILVLGDIKRGDIGSTAEAYAEGHFQWADAVTLHPYLGRDSVEPFLRHCKPGPNGRKAVFVLVRTSNPGAKDFQDLRVGGAAAGDRALCDAVADAVNAWGSDLEPASGYCPVGAVVGATWPEELARLRLRLPRAWLLLPGVGAQGGKVEDLAAAFDQHGLGALVNQSRGVMQCFKPDDPNWLRRIADAAREFGDDCRRVARSRARS